MLSSWLLPEHFSDILPLQARQIEGLRRSLLDLYRSYGYEQVVPPMVEYLDSLMSASDSSLRLRTCKLVDQLSGLTMGVRADITPQISRIDAHLLNHHGVTRLCYCGPVVHTRPAGLFAERELLQIGAEIFGCKDVQADIESIGLALESVTTSGVKNARLALSHPSIARALIESDAALVQSAELVFDLLSSKDVPGLQDLVVQLGASKQIVGYLQVLADLYGDVSIIDLARRSLPQVEQISTALTDLELLCNTLGNSNIAIDLADIGSSYAYHTGVVFSIFADGWNDALVRGGRYDGIGSRFGRHRAATGFSLDIRKLASGLPGNGQTAAILAPWSDDPALLAKIRQLRQQGLVVIQALAENSNESEAFVFKQRLVAGPDGWQVQDI